MGPEEHVFFLSRPAVVLMMVHQKQCSDAGEGRPGVSMCVASSRLVSSRLLPLYSEMVHRGSSLSSDAQISLSPDTSSSSFRSILRQYHAQDVVCPVCSGSTLGTPPSGTCLENLHREASRGIRNRATAAQSS